MNEVKHIVLAIVFIIVIVVMASFSMTLFSGLGQQTGSVAMTSSGGSSGGGTTAASLTPEQEKGQQVFKQNCASCHAMDKNLSGPALAGVTGRGPWTDRENLHKWVSNPAAFIPTTPYTQDLQKTYGSVMPGFPGLKKEEVDAIFNWIEAAGRK